MLEICSKCGNHEWDKEVDGNTIISFKPRPSGIKKANGQNDLSLQTTL